MTKNRRRYESLSKDLSRLAPFMPYLRVEEYGRDKSGDGPRFRLELRGCSADVEEAALQLKAGCIACENTIYPFRKRATRGGSVYLAVTCPLSICVGCSRSHAATLEYKVLSQQVLSLYPSNLKKAGERRAGKRQIP